MTQPDIQVFISVKQLDEDGQTTPDVALARELYDRLVQEGLTPFLSSVTLEQMGTAEYKGSIDDALDQASVLVAVGTSPANLASRWVRYEWDSFFNDVISGIKPDGKVFSLISGFEPAQLPRALRQNQTFVHEKSGLDYLCNFLTNAFELRQAVSDRDLARQLMEQAERETRRASAISDFLKEILESADPYLGGSGEETTIVEALDRARTSLSERFQDAPELEAAIRQTLGTTYMHIARYDDAEQLLRSALEASNRSSAEGDRLTASITNELGRLLHIRGRLEDADEMFRRSLAICERIKPEPDAEWGAVLNNLGELLRERGNLTEAEEKLRQALAMKQDLFGEAHEEVTPTVNNLGLLLSDLGKFDEAREAFSSALSANRQIWGDDHPNVAINLGNLASAELELGEHEAAERHYLESHDLKLASLGPDHPSVAVALSGVATARERQGKLSDALAAHQEAYRIVTQSLGLEHRRTAVTGLKYGASLIENGAQEKGLALRETSLETLTRELGADHPVVQKARQG